MKRYLAALVLAVLFSFDTNAQVITSGQSTFWLMNHQIIFNNTFTNIYANGLLLCSNGSVWAHVRVRDGYATRHYWGELTIGNFTEDPLMNNNLAPVHWERTLPEEC